MKTLWISAALSLGACAQTPVNTDANLSAPAIASVVLAGTNWTGVSVGGNPVPVNTKVTIAFGAEKDANRAYGTGGCNRFNVDYTQTGPLIKFGMAANTRMACSEEQMATESKFLQTLTAVDRFTVNSDGVLTLAAPDGRLLIFAKS